MIDLTKIPWPTLHAIRQNAGADSGEDTSRDSMLEREEPMDLLRRYSEWHLGDGGWGVQMVEAYRSIKAAARHEEE